MTLVDRPLIQYAVEEARAAGIKEFIFVTSRGKRALEDYFDSASVLEKELRTKGKRDLLETLKATNMEAGEVAYVRQNMPLGLGHAIWCARHLIANEPFAVILPDDVIAAPKPCLQQMVEAYASTQSVMVAAMEVSDAEAQYYGILDVKENFGRIVTTQGMVEKPERGSAPSNLAVIGRYILTPKVIQKLNAKQAGVDDEIQLTDAIDAVLADGSEVHGFRFDGKRFDCGSKTGFLQATIALALDREDLNKDFQTFLQAIMGIGKNHHQIRISQ